MVANVRWVMLSWVFTLAVTGTAGAAELTTRGSAPAGAPSYPGGPLIELRESAEETYALNYVIVVHKTTPVIVRPHGGITTQESWYPVRGKLRTRLGATAFYEAVGRADLHDRARRYQMTTYALLFGGAACFLGGLAVGYATLDREEARISPLSLVAVSTGVVLFLVARSMTEYLSTEAEAVEMARAHNERLRTFLGLPPAIDDPKAQENVTAERRGAQPRRPGLTLLPAVVQGGGGLVLGGAF
jgi:hypothetical protein